MSDNQDQHINAVDYVIGQQTPSERQAMEAHLVYCAHCQAAVESVQQVEVDNVGQNTRALVSYVADLLVSTVVLVAPIANQLSQPLPPPEPQETAAEMPFFEPLRVLQPRVAASANRMRRFVGRFGLVLIATIIVLLLPRPAGLTEAGQHALAAFVFTGSILALEPVSLPIAALMVPLALVALGVANTTEAFRALLPPGCLPYLGQFIYRRGSAQTWTYPASGISDPGSGRRQGIVHLAGHHVDSRSVFDVG